MSDQSLFKAVKLTLPECNKLPEIIKEILNTTVSLPNLKV